MVACFRIGAVVLPCTEQLRAKDLRAAARRRAAGAGRRRRAQPRRAGEAAGRTPTCCRPRRGAARRAEPAPAGRARARGPVPDHVHERHLGRAQGRPPRPALPGRPAASRPSTGSRRGPASSSGARPRSGWSKSARNVFIAPWLRGAAALLHDARFDPAERLELLERERVDVLCMAPTEYRVIAKRAELRPLAVAARPRRRRRGAQPRGAARVARGDRPVDPRRLRPDRDRPAHRHAARRAGPARLDGPRAAGRAAGDRRRRARRRPRDRPDVLPRLPRRRAGARRAVAHRRPRAPRRRRLPLLRGPHRRRDHLRRLPDRPVRGRVRARRPRRPSPRPPSSPRPTTSAARSCARSSCCATATTPSDALARELQEHVKAQTAPYKYPRIVDFADELPKTASGKIRRAALR